MKRRLFAVILAVAAVFCAFNCQGASLGDLLKKFGAFDFGGTDFDESDLDTNQKAWADRDRWVQSALDGAYKALARADKEVNLFDFQNYYNVLSIQWTPGYLQDPEHIGNLNAYATFTEYLSRYLNVKQQLITRIAELNRHYAVLNRVDPRQLTGPFQLDTTGGAKSYTERAGGAVDSSAHQAALATSAGAVEKYTAELNRAIDYGVKLEKYFKRAAGIQ